MCFFVPFTLGASFWWQPREDGGGSQQGRDTQMAENPVATIHVGDHDEDTIDCRNCRYNEFRVR